MIVSARSDEVDKLIGLEVGADDFVLKPFSPRELRARVAALEVGLSAAKNGAMNPSRLLICAGVAAATGTSSCRAIPVAISIIGTPSSATPW